MKLTKFAKYAWFTLAYNMIVVIWGVFLRASKSGDGCGQYWLTCHGEVVPSAPELKTVIEFSHRIMSGIDFFVVLILVIWTFRKFEKSQQIRKFAFVSFVFIITEALIGAGLVLTGNTALALTDARPFWAIGHLINTFILLGALSLTAWTASGGGKLRFAGYKKELALMIAAAAGMLLIGTSGSLAALSSMLFPVETLAEGIRQDFSDASHILLRLRISHPILSVMIGVFLVFLAGWISRKKPENKWLRTFAKAHSALVVFQLMFGAATLFMLAPIVMQLGHLFLADSIWITFILMCACYLGADPDEEPGEKNQSEIT
ncbi:MAG: COX15/CtaA family protein [Pyrinomonadaceae bacterium]